MDLGEQLMHQEMVFSASDTITRGMGASNRVTVIIRVSTFLLLLSFDIITYRYDRKTTFILTMLQMLVM